MLAARKLARPDEAGDFALPIPAIAPDGTLYPVGKLEAHERALFHLAVSVFVFDRRGRLLVQRRAPGKYHCGGLWANTCCSHPNWGEAETACASRRLREELGFSVELQPFSQVEYEADVGMGLFEHERVTFFRGLYRNETIAPAPCEVMDIRWLDAAELLAEIAEAPERFAPWFRIYMDRHFHTIFG